MIFVLSYRCLSTATESVVLEQRWSLCSAPSFVNAFLPTGWELLLSPIHFVCCDSSYSVISDLHSAKIRSQHSYLGKIGKKRDKFKFFFSVMEITWSFFGLSEMSSVPISKAYVSKRSNQVKNNPARTLFHNQMEENSTRRFSPPESRKYSETFGSDCKVTVLWDVSSVRLYIETRKWWNCKFSRIIVK